MSDATGTGRSNWKDELRPVTAELSRMVTLRRELAALEINHDRQLTRRCLTVGLAGAILVLVALPLLLHAAADALSHITTLNATTWNVILGSALAAPGIMLLAFGLRKFRAEFCGLRGTLAELNEDLIWLREWTQTDVPAGDGPASGETLPDEASF